MKVRPLYAHEIECRVQTIRENGCSLLLYKDARVDMALLDETFGSENWQRTHEVINGNMFCNIDIWGGSEKGWIRKQDVGVESQTEKTKGEASDSFKRAGFNIGIGRELYTSPFIWVNLEKGEAQEYQGKWRLGFKTKFKVGEIECNEAKVITALTIVDQGGAVRFRMGQFIKAPKVEEEKTKSKPKQSQKEIDEVTGKQEKDILAKVKTEIAKINKCKTTDEILMIWDGNDDLWEIQEFADGARKQTNKIRAKAQQDEAKKESAK